jgi:hypothetical protein
MTERFSWRLGLVFILAFWAGVSLSDYPMPFIDDAFYIGAAINLAQHGVFANPYCEMLATIGSMDHFFANMPLHDYIVAGWLKLFGVSTLSFHVLYTLLALGVSLLIYRLFPATRYSALAAVFIALLVFGLLGGAGLRADSLGWCFLLAGFDTWRTRTPLAFFWRNIFLGLVVITFPNVALFGMALTVAGLIHQKFFQQRSWGELVPFAVVAVVAYALCFGLFLVCIGGRLTEFLHSLVGNQRLSAEGVRERFQFFTVLGISKWVVVQASFLVLVGGLLAAWRMNRERREGVFFLVVALAIFVALGLSSVNSASGAHTWAFACLVTGLFIITTLKWDYRAWILYAVVAFFAAFGHAHTAIQFVLADRPLDRAACDSLRAQIEQMQPPRLYVDTYAMRELYDYRLPPNTFAFETSSTTGWGGPRSVATMPKPCVAVTTVDVSFPTPGSPAAGHAAQRLVILGRPVTGVARNPYQLEIMDNR